MSDPAPLRLHPASPEIAATHALLVRAFAFMAGRIDPPSSLGRMSPDDLAREAGDKELWIIPGPLACVLLSPKPDHLYLGKLAVAEGARGTGLARRLVGLALERARHLNLPQVRLETRVELVENHAAFARLGFREAGRTAHAGYDRPTSITFVRDV